MPSKKKAWLILIGMAGVALSCFFFSLPRITANFLVSQAERAGLKNLQFKAIHVGWQRLDLTDVSLGDATDPSLRIPHLSVHYSLAGLWQKRIKSVRIAGLWIKIEDRGRGFQFHGMIDPPPARAQNGEMPRLERFILENSNLHLAWAGRSLEIPIRATLRASGTGYSFSALLRPLAETVRLHGTIDNNFTSAKMAFTIPGFSLPALIDQAGLGSAARGKGRLAAEGKIILEDGNFKTAAVSVSGLGELQLAVPDQASVMLDSFYLAFALDPGVIVRDIIAGARGRQFHVGEIAVEAPFSLDIRGRQWPDLEFFIRDLRVARPLPVTVERINGKTAGPWAAAQISGSFRLQNGNRMLAALGLPGETTQPYVIDGDFQGSLKAGSISWTMKAMSKSNFAVALARDSLRGRLDLSASLKGDAQRLHASAALRMSAADLRLAGTRARAEVFSGDAELDYIFGRNFQGRGQVRISGGNIAAGAGNGLAAAGVNLNLPWHWPGGGRGAEGGFSIAKLQINGWRGEDIHGILIQEDKTLRFSGSLHSVLTTIGLTFQGHYAPDATAASLLADFSVQPVVLPAKTELQPLHPLLSGMSGGGRFQAQGRIWAGNDSTGGSVVVKIANADFEQPKEKIALSGVNAEIRIDNLLDFVTPPAQRIDFREMQWQDMLFSNGEMVFSGESGGTVFIESGRFGWCQGKISLAPLRIKPGAGDYLMTFAFDRVHFAQMLNALVGKTIVSGDAEMSGIVPIRMVKGSPVFLDSYLFSTPGKGGNLKVSQPELIANGQMLVEEAIRDFRYKWIKIKLGNRNDLLDMVVSIDGAPARKLPLRYDAKQKDFVRDPKGGRHVELKGLLLDIRFLGIDLKDLLKAGSQMTSSHQLK